MHQDLKGLHLYGDSMQHMSFDPRYLDWIRSGAKTRTTRYAESVEEGPVRFTFETNPPEHLDAVITGIQKRALSDLRDEDAAAENFADADALRDALQYHYPGIQPDATVAIVSFDLI